MPRVTLCLYVVLSVGCGDKLPSMDESLKKWSPKVDAKLSTEHKHDFVAHDASDNMMASVDAVLNRLEQQLRKYKDKVVERHRQPDAKRQEATD